MSETRRQQATASSSMLAIDLTSRPTFRMYPLGLVDNLGELRWLQNKRSIFPSMCITRPGPPSPGGVLRRRERDAPSGDFSPERKLLKDET